MVAADQSGVVDAIAGAAGAGAAEDRRGFRNAAGVGDDRPGAAADLVGQAAVVDLALVGARLMGVDHESQPLSRR